MSSKLPDYPKGVDRSTNRRKEEQEAIEELIANDVPSKRKCRTHPADLASLLISKYKNPSLFVTGRFSKTKEIAKLHDLVAASKRLGSTWANLDPEVKGHLKSTHRTPERKIVGSRFRSVSDSQLIQFFFFGTELMERFAETGEEFIRSGQEIGRKNLAAIRLVHCCADAWEMRTGERPESANHAPFAGFVEGVFGALSIDERVSVENSIRAWAAEDGA